MGNMDSQIFLGGSEPTTLKDLSEMLGKETIDAFNTSDTRGNSPSYGTTFQKMGHELLSRDELAVLDGGKCILQLRGVRPFLSDKYDLTQHPNYKLTSDYDPKNTFDIEKYLNRKEKINPNDELEKRIWNSSTLQSKFFRLWSSLWVLVWRYGVSSTFWKVTVTTTLRQMLMYGREAQSKTRIASPATIPKSGERNRKIHSCMLYLISI